MNHDITEYNKALVAVGGAIIAIAGVFGTTIDPAVVTTVVSAITAVLVLIIPNARPVRENFTEELDWDEA